MISSMFRTALFATIAIGATVLTDQVQAQLCTGLNCTQGGGNCPPASTVLNFPIPEFIPEATSGVQSSVTIPAFSPPAGTTLIAIQVEVTAQAPRARLQFENTNQSSPCTTGSAEVSVGVLPLLRATGVPVGGTQFPDNCGGATPLWEFRRPLPSTIPAFDGAIDFGGCGRFGCAPGQNQQTPCPGDGTGCPLQGSGLTFCGAPLEAGTANPAQLQCSRCILSGDATFNAVRNGAVSFVLSGTPQQQEFTQCGSQINASRICLGGNVRVTYFYCPVNLPPCANNDTATICPSNNLDCDINPIQIAVLANDCDPNHCTGAAGSGQINCNSLRLCSLVAPANCGLTTIFDAASQPTAVAGDPNTFVWKAELTLGGGTGSSACAAVPPAAECTPTGTNCAGTFVTFTPGRRNGGLAPASTVSFNYRIFDNDPTTPLSDDATVFITVCRPPDALDDCIVVCKDSTTPTIFNVLANDTDGESFDPPAAGFPTCACSPIDPASLTILGGAPQPDGSVRVAGGTVRVNQPCGTVTTNCDVSCANDTPTPSCANRCLTYVPDVGTCGTFTFRYRIQDVGAGNQRCCDTATVTVNVVAPNTDPDEAIVCEDRPSTCSGNATCDASCANHAAIIPVLFNDDLTSCTTTVTLTTSFNCSSVEFVHPVTGVPLPAAGGGLFITPLGGRVQANQACGGAANNGCNANCVRYTPPVSTCGTDSFGYTFTANYGACPTGAAPQSPTTPVACKSDVGVVTVTIKPAPRPLDDVFCLDSTVAPGTPQVFDVLGNDDDMQPPALCGPITIDPLRLELLCTNPLNCSAASCPAPGGHGTFDVVLEGGVRKIRFTENPLNPLPVGESESICYRVYGQPTIPGNPASACCSIARITVSNCDCPPTNRRECASLLLFPEFDNRPGRVTMITITDGCCAEPNSLPLFRVQLKFVNSSNCLTADAYRDLTICDTVTFLTTSMNSGGTNARGYLYAYVSDRVSAPGNPTGSPIVYDHIIGQSLLLDSIESLDYSMNAVGFKGIGEHLAFNDDDRDGIRDFNGAGHPFPEYEQVPDTLKIPRFFGQDWNTRDRGVYKSRLILVNMSGGRAFTTTINLGIFNDNEYAFSGQYTFFCWDKPFLKDIAESFLELNLDFSDNDPDELFGMPEKETGWFTIDGEVAVSSAETIVDPAVYAVLVEVTGRYSAADLPWECDCQDADLLPLSIFGDGGNTAVGAPPVNGDNQ